MAVEISIRSTASLTASSLIKRKAGSGHVIVCNGIVLNGHSQHTRMQSAVLQNEVLAISHCASTLASIGVRKRNIIYHADSQAAILAIKRTNLSSAKGLDCFKPLNDLAGLNNVLVKWIPGHTGFVGNERADEPANLVRLDNISAPIQQPPLFIRSL